MNITTIYQRLTSRHFNQYRPRRRAPLAAGRRARSRPRLELLEDRCLLSLSVSLTGTTVTLDETAGLQNSVVTPNPPNPPGDADDNDVAVSTLPLAFSSRLTADGAVVTTPPAINGAESNGNVISISGVTGTISNLAFTDANGGPLDGDSSGLTTTDGTPILLFSDAVNDNIVLGRTGGVAGPIVFAVYLEETGSPVSGGKFWSIQFAALHHNDATNPDDSIDLGTNLKVAVSESQSFSFAGAPSGSNEFMMFGNSTSAIVVNGLHPDPNTEDNISKQPDGNSFDTVSSSQGSGTGTTLGTDGQHVAPGHSMYFTFVTGANPDFTVPNLSPTEANHEGAIQFTGYQEADGASVTISQMNPTNATVSVSISAFNETEGAPGTGFPLTTDTGYVESLNNDTPVTINSVKINGAAVNITPGSSVIVSGVKNGDVITYTTDSDHNRVLIGNANPTKGNGSNVTFDIGGFNVTNLNAASAVVGTQVVFEDDGPSTSLALKSGVTLTVDETTLGTTATDTAAHLFTTTDTPGADGLASAGTSWALAVNSASSGLTDTASGLAVTMAKSGSDIVGSVVVSGVSQEVFRISIDASTGAVTLKQSRAVVQPDKTSPDTSETVGLTAGSVGVSRTITDGDGDTAMASADASSLFKFADDGPSTSLALKSGVTLTVDETTLGTTATDTAANLFTTTDTPGADGLASAGTSWALAVNSASSGLTDTASGLAVTMAKSGSDIVGSVVVSGVSQEVFRISIDASTGAVTLKQSRAVVQPDKTSPDTSETVGLTAGSVGVSRTITDGDGDTATASADASSLFKFADDGPSTSLALKSGVTLTVDETTLGTTATDTAAHLFTTTDTPGADGLASAGTSWALAVNSASSGLTDTASGLAVTMAKSGSDIVGSVVVSGVNQEVFRISIDASTGAVTLKQSRAVVQPDKTSPDTSETVGLTAGSVGVSRTITDGDGDTATASADASSLFKFADDGPSTSLALKSGVTLTVDETTLGTTATDTAAHLFTTTDTPGADGLASAGTSWALAVNSASSGLTDTASGLAVTMAKSGSDIVGSVVVSGVSQEVFRISIDTSTGAVTLKQSRAVVQPDKTSPDTSETVGLTAGSVGVSRTITDGDGDTATASADASSLFKFADDGPSVTAASNINIQNSGDVAATGTFAYNLGADGSPTNNDVFKAVTGSATVDGISVQNYTISQTSEDQTSAIFTFGFDYPIGGGATAHETGTLTFNKVAGKYTVDLANPIAGFTVLSTGSADASTFVSYQVPAGGSGIRRSPSPSSPRTSSSSSRAWRNPVPGRAQITCSRPRGRRARSIRSRRRASPISSSSPRLSPRSRSRTPPPALPATRSRVVRSSTSISMTPILTARLDSFRPRAQRRRSSSSTGSAGRRT